MNMEEYLDARRASVHRSIATQWGSIAVALTLVMFAGLLVRPINEVRRACQIGFDEQTLKGLPPDVNLMTKMGTLRALAVDIAFIRLENLKQENRFYELMQLSDTLCKLIPRSASVWSYSAWNMAYNISVCQYTNEARWLWVKNGIRNLRNLGIVYNPKSITLYKELAWIFYHKIGDRLDDSHMAYKRELAVEIQIILGEPPLALTEEEALANFKAIQSAPKDIDKWIEQNAEAAKLVNELKELGLPPGIELLEFVARNMRTYSSSEGLLANQQKQENLGRISAIKAVLSNPEYAGTVDTLIAAVRRKTIEDVDRLNMKVDWMLQLMEDYGPIDWRTPFAHTLYWATYGDMETKGSLNINPADSMNAVRFIFFALQSMVRSGNVLLEPNFDKPNESFLQMMPDTRFIHYMHEAYLKFGKEQFGDDPRFIPGTSGPNYLSGHRNFLMEGIRQLYLQGGEDNLQEAKEYYFYLRKFDRTPEGKVKPQYNVNFEEFVFNTLYEALETQSRATAMVSELLLRSLKDLADGELDRSVIHFNQAKKWRDFYMKDMEYDRNQRRSMEKLGVMRRDVAMQFMMSPAFSALQKYRLWHALDTATRQAIYDNALPLVEKQCEVHNPQLDPAKVMPVPPGMKEYRENPDSNLKNLQYFDPTVSVGEKKSE